MAESPRPALQEDVKSLQTGTLSPEERASQSFIPKAQSEKPSGPGTWLTSPNEGLGQEAGAWLYGDPPIWGGEAVTPNTDLSPFFFPTFILPLPNFLNCLANCIICIIVKFFTFFLE